MSEESNINDIASGTNEASLSAATASNAEPTSMRSKGSDTAHVGTATVPLPQYENLVSKVNTLEDLLARVDGVVNKELVQPLLDGVPDLDAMNDPGFSSYSSEFHEWIRLQNSSLRESTVYLRRLRQHRQYLLQQRLEKSMTVDEETITARLKLEATVAAQVAHMLNAGTPAKALRTTWAAFQPSKLPPPGIFPLPKEMSEREKIESIVNPLELLIGEPETTISWSKDRKPASSSTASKDIDPGAFGQSSPLPERVLLHSEEVLDILAHVTGHRLQRQATLSLHQPFKVLVHYEKSIRNLAARLEEENLEDTTEGGPSASLESEAAENINSSGTESSDSSSDVSSESSLSSHPSSPTHLLHIRCLLDFMNEVNAKKNQVCSTQCQRVTFSDLWYLFQPGEEVIDENNKQAYRVVRVTMPIHKSTSPFERLRKLSKEDGEMDEEEKLYNMAKIDCVFIDFDGEKIGPVLKTFEIPRFEQDKPITSLPVFPLNKVREIGYRDELIERGKMLWDVIQVRAMYYNGHTIDTREEADSQVVIDFSEAMIYAQEHRKEWKPPVAVITKSLEATYDDSYVEVYQSEGFIESQLQKSSGERPSLIIFPQTIGEILDGDKTPYRDELLIMSYRVFGFILRSRKWAPLDLTYMKYDNENSRANVLGAFDRLILPDGHKGMVKSLVTQHFREKRVNKTADRKRSDAKTDLIRGKGQGLIILLHGAPGVGKTTTAEGVAETFKRPLFQITSGDLGTSASEVQEELEKTFTLASKWDCILLLDEAEVFLASRDRKDVQRNGLVAVFLRVLEYYKGILFLTTNRVGDFDEAFASRIHMSLHYPKLDLNKTIEVFKVNIQLINDKFKLQNRKIFLDEDSIIDFAEKHFNVNNTADGRGLLWNGRQIRNACQTALAMAEFEALDSELSDEVDPAQVVQLKLQHFKTVEMAYNDFATYLGETYGVSQDERMAEFKIRRDDYEPTDATAFKRQKKKSV